MPETRPNIVVFHCDQLRYDALGCTGHPGEPTPHIDALAREGHAFTRHFATNPVCMPSRASFMTGLPITAHGVWTNGVPLNRKAYQPFGDLPGSVYHEGLTEYPTLADCLADGGYATGAFGKLHLTPSLDREAGRFPESEASWTSGKNADWNGPYYGFQHVELTHSHGEVPEGHYRQWLKAEYPEIHDKALENHETAERPIPEFGGLFQSILPYDAHPSTWIARRSLSWIYSQKANPFFAFLGFPDPHAPMNAVEEDLRHFNKVEMNAPVDPDGSARPDLQAYGKDVRGFSPEQHDLVRFTTAGMVRTIDRAIGEVVSALKAAGIWENTVILFTSDHGDFLGDHGRLLKDTCATEQLLHVPCLLRLPGSEVRKAPRLSAATSNMDILPTLLDLAGIEVPGHVQGTSLFADPSDAPYAYAHAFNGTPARANFTIFDEQYRYTVYPDSGHKELFDHTDDRLESNNLSGKAVAAEDEQRLHAALAEYQLKAVNPVAGRLSLW